MINLIYLSKTNMAKPQNYYTLVVCNDLSGKESYRQVDVGRVMASRRLGDVIVNTPARNTRDVGSISTLPTIFPIFITPTIVQCNFISV